MAISDSDTTVLGNLRRFTSVPLEQSLVYFGSWMHITACIASGVVLAGLWHAGLHGAWVGVAMLAYASVCGIVSFVFARKPVPRESAPDPHDSDPIPVNEPLYLWVNRVDGALGHLGRALHNPITDTKKVTLEGELGVSADILGHRLSLKQKADIEHSISRVLTLSDQERYVKLCEYTHVRAPSDLAEIRRHHDQTFWKVRVSDVDIVAGLQADQLHAVGMSDELGLVWFRCVLKHFIDGHVDLEGNLAVVAWVGEKELPTSIAWSGDGPRPSVRLRPLGITR